MAICSYLVTTLVPHRTPFLLLAALLIPTIVYAADFSGSVISVLHGDTLEVLNGHHAERIRLSGIDCPNYSQVAPRNRVAFNSPAEAEEAGYRVAGNCPEGHHSFNVPLDLTEHRSVSLSLADYMNGATTVSRSCR